MSSFQCHYQFNTIIWRLHFCDLYAVLLMCSFLVAIYLVKLRQMRQDGDKKKPASLTNRIMLIRLYHFYINIKSELFHCSHWAAYIYICDIFKVTNDSSKFCFFCVIVIILVNLYNDVHAYDLKENVTLLKKTWQHYHLVLEWVIFIFF